MRNFTQTVRLLTLLTAIFMVSFGAMAQTIIFEENFDKFSAGTPNGSANGTNVATTIDNYTTETGWSAASIYQAGGSVKFGTASVLGWIETPVLNLSGNEGNCTVTFDAMAWSTDATELKLIVDGVTYLVEGLNNDATYTFKSFSVAVQGSETSTIRFEAKQAAKGRFFLDNLKVYGESVQAVPSFTAPAALRLPLLEVNQTATATAVVKGEHLTGSLTVAISGEGFTTTVSTLTKEEAEAGASIPVTFVGTTIKEYTGTLTISGGGAESKVVALTAATFNATVEGQSTWREDFEKSERVATGYGDFTVEGREDDVIWTVINGRGDDKISGERGVMLRNNTLETSITSSVMTGGVSIFKFSYKQPFGTLTNFKVKIGDKEFGPYISTELNKVEHVVLENVAVEGDYTIEFVQAAATFTGQVTIDDLVWVSNKTVTSTPSVGNNASVYAANGRIVIASETREQVALFNIAGQLVKSAVVTEGETTIAVEKGLYIVRVGLKATKVAVN